jgi:hypothetical protein
LIRPNVRLLPRSLRLWVRVPNSLLVVAAISGQSGCSYLQGRHLLKFLQYLAVMLRQVSNDFRVAKQSTDVSIGISEAEVVKNVLLKVTVDEKFTTAQDVAAVFW